MIHIEHAVFKPGLTADQCVLIIKKSGRKPLKPAIQVGINNYGKKFRWFLKDATLTFGRKSNNGPHTLLMVTKPIDPAEDTEVKPGTEEYKNIVEQYEKNKPEQSS